MNIQLRHIALAAICALTLRAPHAATEQAAYLPACYSPQPGAPAQPTGAIDGNRAAGMAWNGSEYGAFWLDRNNSKHYFRRFYADGTPAAGPVLIANGPAGSGFRPDLAWDGTAYGAVWTETNGGYLQVMFARFDANGAILAGPTRLSNYLGTPASTAYQPAIAWGGGSYAVTWMDQRNSGSAGFDIYGAFLSGAGVVQYSDLRLSNETFDAISPRMAFAAGSGRFYFFWYVYNTGSFRYEISNAWFGLTPGGGGYSIGGATSIAVGASGFDAFDPDVSAGGSGIAVAWTDYRTGTAEINFARFSAFGAKLGGDVNLTNSGTSETHVSLAWTGYEWGLAYANFAPAGIDTRFMRIAPDGAAGASIPLTYDGASAVPNLAFGRYGFLLTYSTFLDNSNTGASYMVPVLCNYSYPPACPGNLVGYNVSGSNATVGWVAPDDGAVDIAYYQVLRNGTPVGLSSRPYYNDSGLSVGTPYNYAIRAVNAGQSVSAANCPSIYVKTSASLTLTVNKSSLDAALNWTEAGLNNYRVFRGVSPQVMSAVGDTPATETTHPNALADTVSYFYSIDDPGP